MDKLMEIEQRYCSQGDTSGKRNPKKYFTAANGNFLYDEYGVAYLDMQMLNGSACFGYQHPVFHDKLLSQAAIMPGLAPEFMNENRVMLSAKICEYMKENYGINGRVHFNVGGASAVDDAIKLIANFKKTRDVFTFEGSYHGRTIAASGISSSYRYVRQFGTDLHTYRIPFPNCNYCAYAMHFDKCNLFCLEQFSRLFKNEFYGIYDTNAKSCKYAAFIAEPILGRSGYVCPPDGYFKKLKEILDEYGLLFVSDEIQMGFFKTGRLWSFEHFNIMPDIVIFSKAISNGIWPLSGVWAREEIIAPNIWPTGSSHATFTGHPIATALGLAAFSIIEEPDFKEKIQKSAAFFHTIIQGLKRDFSFIGRLDMIGHVVGFDIVNNDNTPNPTLARAIVETALNRVFNINGTDYCLIMNSGGMFNNSIMLSPSVFISENEIELFNVLIRHYIHLVANA